MIFLLHCCIRFVKFSGVFRKNLLWFLFFKLDFCAVKIDQSKELLTNNKRPKLHPPTQQLENVVNIFTQLWPPILPSCQGPPRRSRCPASPGARAPASGRGTPSCWSARLGKCARTDEECEVLRTLDAYKRVSSENCCRRHYHGTIRKINILFFWSIHTNISALRLSVFMHV